MLYFHMFPLVSNFVLSFQLYSFPVFLVSFYLILTAIQFILSVPLLDCCLLEFIYSLGSLSKLTRRPRGGGHIQISIRLKSE